MRRTLLPVLMAAASLATATLLAGCGQKGALYLPDKNRNAVVTPVASPAPMASPLPATTPVPATAPAPEANPAAAPEPATDPTKPDSQRRSNNPPRTN
jgi:predicted small lipoprotein YifL